MRRVADIIRDDTRDPGETKSTDSGIVINGGERVITVRLDRTDWPTRGKATDNIRLREVIKANLWLKDDVKDWYFWGSVATEGGDYFTRFGDYLLETTFRMKLPAGTNRLVQIRCDQKVRMRLKVHLDLD